MLEPKRDWKTFESIEEELEKLDSYKLKDLLNYYNIKEDQKHTAMQDVLDLLELLKVVKPKKWSKLGSSSSNDKIKRNYVMDKKEREEDKVRLELAKENINTHSCSKRYRTFKYGLNKERVNYEN